MPLAPRRTSVAKSRAAAVQARGTHDLAMSSSCSVQKIALLECLADSPCMASGRSIKECMDDATESGCSGVRHAYFACKRRQLDMRKRIKGNILKGGDEDPRSKI